ncbi:MAG: aminopeptidase, partial [Gemmatimonadetes bacterium 21-71-4]
MQIPPQTRGVRLGAWGDSLYQVGQWYPRVAVFDDLREGGWDTEPYLGTSEFYNNFGHFDVKLTLPAGWLVGATGVLQNPGEVLTAAERERLSHVLDTDTTLRILGPGEFGPGKATAAAAGDSVVWHFVADTVGDVAWAASDRYVWDASRANIPGKGEIPVNIFYLPGHTRQFADAGPTVRHALEFYSGLWMPYSFPLLTMVDGPENGMEYPMFIMSGVGAADHETGHEWWPMTLGTNETWYPFMDEGFNQYMNILSRDDRQRQPADLDGWGQAYGRTSGNEREAPLMWDANYGGPMYAFQGYGKAPMMLSMLGGVVGDTAVWRA